RRARQSLKRKPGRQYRGHPGGAEALWPAAARPRAAGAARRTAAGADLSSHRTAGAGPRPSHQDDGPTAHAGAAGLDLRLAGVELGILWPGYRFAHPGYDPLI